MRDIINCSIDDMQVVNSTYALWTWHRNHDIYKEDRHGDQIYIVRQPEKCLTTSEAFKVIYHKTNAYVPKYIYTHTHIDTLLFTKIF